MNDALHFFLTSIVDHPEAVKIDEEDREGITTYIIQVHSDDMGKVIGKEGKVIRSIRNVMKILAMKQNKRFNITLAEQKSE